MLQLKRCPGPDHIQKREPNSQRPMGKQQARRAALNNMDAFLAAEERRAYNMALMATRNPDDALEIVQDAMYKLVQKYAHKDPASWGPLFTRVLQNRIKNWYRKQAMTARWFSRAPEKEGSDELSEYMAGADIASDDESHSPRAETEQQRFMSALEKALQALPARQQQVFLLRAVQGMDVSETAAAMSCSAGSVKTHYSRALQKLKTQLAEFSS